MMNVSDRFRGLEIMMDNLRIEQDLLPDNVSIETFSEKRQVYFKKFGFKVPKLWSEIYSKYNGIESEKYIPTSIYMYYINPYLLNMNLSSAYVDKNMYFRHFPMVRQPETVVHNIRGCYFSPCLEERISFDEAVGLVSEEKQVIVKPAIESGKGRDVKLLRAEDVDVAETLLHYKEDFIVQKIVKQNASMSKLNPTSLNTCRVYTYRRVDNGEYVVLGAAVRFGGVGAFRDNACTGGGFCKIHDDGRIDDVIHRYRDFARGSLKNDKGIDNNYFPNYDKVIAMCMTAHRAIPYMDLVGWDMAVSEDGDPILIELNQYPDCELIQIFNGPMFGEYTDELMCRVSKHTLRDIVVYKRSFEGASDHCAYNFEIGKAYTI